MYGGDVKLGCVSDCIAVFGDTKREFTRAIHPLLRVRELEKRKKLYNAQAAIFRTHGYFRGECVKS